MSSRTCLIGNGCFYVVIWVSKSDKDAFEEVLPFECDSLRVWVAVGRLMSRYLRRLSFDRQCLL